MTPVRVVGAIVLVPLVVLAVRVILDGASAPVGDVGLIALRVGDVPGRLPVLGSYSRFGYNQPGPLLFYVLAVPFQLLGRRFAGIEIGAIALAAASVAVVLGVAHRRFGTAGLLVAGSTSAVFLHGLGPRWLADPWEPHVLVLVGLALVALAFDAVAGRPTALIVLGAGASLIAQAWSTMLPFAVVMGVWALIGAAVRAWRQPDLRRSTARAVTVTAALVAVLWVPPLVEQATGHPGNLSAMASALGGPGPRLGVADTWRAVAPELGLRPTWIGFPQRLDGLSTRADLAHSPVVPVGAIVLVVGLMAAQYRRRTDIVLLGVTAALATATAVLALSRLLGPVYVWIPQWLRLIGASAWVAGVAGTAALVPERVRTGLSRGLGPLAVVVIVVVGGLTSVAATRSWRERDLFRDAVLDLTAAAPRPAGTTLVRSDVDASLPFGSDDLALDALVAGLERRGVDVVVERRLRAKFGPERTSRGDASAQIVLADADAAVPSGFTTIASVDPLGDLRAERVALLTSVGLPADTTRSGYFHAAQADPSVVTIAEAFGSIPDLPRLRLLAGPAPATASRR